MWASGYNIFLRISISHISRDEREVPERSAIAISISRDSILKNKFVGNILPGYQICQNHLSYMYIHTYTVVAVLYSTVCMIHYSVPIYILVHTRL